MNGITINLYAMCLGRLYKNNIEEHILLLIFAYLAAMVTAALVKIPRVPPPYASDRLNGYNIVLQL